MDVLCGLEVALRNGDAGEFVVESRVKDARWHALGFEEAQAVGVGGAGGGEVFLAAVEVAESVVHAVGVTLIFSSSRAEDVLWHEMPIRAKLAEDFLLGGCESLLRSCVITFEGLGAADA